jgi:putative sigma-54 modulation protein
MQVKINSVQFKADIKLENFIEERLAKLNNYYDHILGSEVFLRLENTNGPDNKITEIRLSIPGNDLFAKKQSKTFEEATDQAIEALRRQIKKHKEKVK